LSGPLLVRCIVDFEVLGTVRSAETVAKRRDIGERWDFPLGDGTMRSVQFKNRNTNMANKLYLPSGFKESGPYPAIVCVHPGGGVKEQTAGVYAQRLAEQGFVALAYDSS
jgi:hypothetical protein